MINVTCSKDGGGGGELRRTTSKVGSGGSRSSARWDPEGEWLLHRPIFSCFATRYQGTKIPGECTDVDLHRSVRSW